MLNYAEFFTGLISSVKKENRYRRFVELQRSAEQKVIAKDVKANRDVTLWCMNDYLGMSSHKDVIDTFIRTASVEGVGSGGTRNIGGNNTHIVALETELANLHNKDAALVFTSGYVANETSLATLAKLLPRCIFFSDELNHASIIEGIRHHKPEKYIFKHNDAKHLEELISKVDINAPKIIVFESAYSMEGVVSPMKEICRIAKKYNALTYVDEVHTVGLYGREGSGMANQVGVSGDIDILQGTLAKAYGTIGGYITGNKQIIDAIRTFAPGFIFTTSLPSAIAAAALTSILHVKNNETLRAKHLEQVSKTKEALRMARIHFIENETHIIPVIIGDPIKAETASRRLFEEFGIYVQHINYPTVARGTERLRITPTPLHTDEMIEHLVRSLKIVLSTLEVESIAA